MTFLIHLLGRAHCSVTFLRSLNAMVNCVAIPIVVRGIQRLLREQYSGIDDRPASKRDGKSLKAYSDHTSLNISLFPVSFFFSALYYTDVISTFSVLVCYWVFLLFSPQLAGLRFRSKPTPSSSLQPQSRVFQGLAIVFVGLISLSFRQTNIFWVSIYLGGMGLVRTLKGGKSKGFSNSKRDTTLRDIIQGSWNRAGIYDPPAAEANLTGLSPVSLEDASLLNACRLLQNWSLPDGCNSCQPQVMYGGYAALCQSAWNIHSIHILEWWRGFGLVPLHAKFA